MGCEYICDGCGKRESAEKGERGYIKPWNWFQRSDKDGIQVACSRRCIENVAEKSGKTRVVFPV